jgi:hypothetical protein
MAQGVNQTADPVKRWSIEVQVGEQKYSIGINPELTRDQIDQYVPVVTEALSKLLHRVLDGDV